MSKIHKVGNSTGQATRFPQEKEKKGEVTYRLRETSDKYQPYTTCE